MLSIVSYANRQTVNATAQSLIENIDTIESETNSVSQGDKNTWFDDFMDPVTGQNLLTNPGFELGDTTGWWGDGLKVIPTGRNSLAHSGKFVALTSNRVAPWDGAGQNLMGEMADGKTYRISGWIRIENAESSPIELIVSQRDSNGFKWEPFIRSLAYNDRWTYFSGLFTIKVDGLLTALNLQIGGPPAEVNFYLDDFEIVEVVEIDWRINANHRIEQIRKRDAKITILTPHGEPISNTNVQIRQTKHRFGFGNCIGSKEISNPDYLIFFKKHFEWAVMGGATKWLDNELLQGQVNYFDADHIIDFCSENEIKIRGHCLYWAGNNRDWVKNLVYAPLPAQSELLTAVENRMQSAINHFKDKFMHWDINNEMLIGSLFRDRLGDSIRIWMFQEANRIDPNCLLFVNETHVISEGGFLLQACKDLVINLISQGAPIHGIGVQCHMERSFDRRGVLSRFNSIAELGLPIWITEFDVPEPDENIRAKDLEDFYRIAFSHLAVEGIMMWDFWENANWRPDWYIVNADWTLNEAGRRYESIMNEWTTELDITTDEYGQISFRGFHGTYEITLMKNGKACAAGFIELLPNQGIAEFTLDQFAPIVEIMSHGDYTTVDDGITTLTASATDDYGIQRVEFYIDDILRYIDCSEPFSYDWDASYFEHGLHTISVRAVDTSGQHTIDKVSLIVNKLNPGQIIYGDSLRSGWSISSSVELNLNHSSTVHTGMYAISYNCSEAWHGVVFESDTPIHSDDYRSINFYVLGSVGGEKLYVQVHCTNGNRYGNRVNEHHIQGGKILSSEWGLVTVKLDELGVPRGQQIKKLEIANPQGTALVYIDDIQLTPPVVSDNPPTAAMNRPVDGATIAGFERVLVNAEDDNGIEKVEFYIDGELRFTDDTGPLYRFDWDTSNDPNGQYKLAVLAYDTIGQNALDEITVDVNHAADNLQPVFDGFETGDFNTFDWITSGDADWVISTQAYSGIYCAQAGSIGNNYTSTLSLTLECVDGDITFYRNVSSERDFDYLKFYIDGRIQEEWSGNQDWIEVSFPVEAGTRTFEWTYSKDSSASRGEDTAWIDDLEFPCN